MRIRCTAMIGALMLAANAHAGDVAIAFPDGTTAMIHARPTPRWRIVSSDGPPLSSIYEELREEAEGGDATAAYALGNALRRCWFPPTPSDFCVGITQSQAISGNDWIKQAALAGYPPAAMAYAQQLKNPKDLLPLYLVAWRDGQYLAASNLAVLYERGQPGALDRDPVKALAFSLIGDGITQHRLAGSTTTLRITTREMSAQAHARRLAAVTTAERRVAIALAHRLLKENPNCCYGF